jgi:hypothetical protein
MDNALKGIMLAVGVVITCVVIGLAFYYSRESKNLSSKASGDLNDLTSEFDDPQKQTFDGITVTGSEVIKQIEKYSTDDTTNIRVIHKQNKDNVDFYGKANIKYCATQADLVAGTSGETTIAKVSNLTYDRTYDSTSSDYINPTATFVGSVQRNADNVITLITFIQEGADTTLATSKDTSPGTSASGAPSTEPVKGSTIVDGAVTPAV